MGFAVFMPKEFVGIEPSERSDVFMNSLFIHLVQFLMIFCVWKYAESNENFKIT